MRLFRREDIAEIVRYHEYRVKSFDLARPDPLCPICGRTMGHFVTLLVKCKSETVYEIHASCPKGKPNYSELEDHEIKAFVRHIIATSRSDEQIRQRIRDELGYESAVALVSHRLGYSAMVMIMMFGPRGNTISI